MKVLMTCPRCHYPTLLGAGDCCTNRFKNGGVCGFSLPLACSGSNRKVCEKVGKHVAPAASGYVSGDHSWTDTTENYARSQEYLLTSGSLYFDPRNHFPALVAPLCSGGPAATVRFSGTCTDEPARRALMPLNSRPQNLHHHFVADLAGLVPLATGDGLVVALSGVIGGGYQVYSGGIAPENFSFKIDLTAASGQQFLR